MPQPAREARLRPDYAQIYPFLTPGVWEPANVLAEKVIAWHLQFHIAQVLHSDRILALDHFGFRGGDLRREGDGSTVANDQPQARPAKPSPSTSESAGYTTPRLGSG